ncbi:carbon-nitrogen hydrolase family protein [Bermanella marisrubri]|uniref:Predicted amidohydrolase n=1 Tax=Bermanella marisrubri TaxID=207949 RepID=Q1MYM0_9GAMM|nr:carbon-nitrogen hydrolase family protein [Bermanella marisrubri]EAT11096.1 predicted amidohydrolase [Oceanobacter sp. RED65] [Bermanella marisrubri]QIZ83404.1 carbon-nitrogen hydrolase family protein [Bermanella marisrubri]
MTQTVITVGLVQMTSGKAVQPNLRAAEAAIKRCVEQGATTVLLPEMFVCLGVKNQVEIAQTQCQKGGPVRSQLSALAKDFKVNIIAGSMPLMSSVEDKVLAACLVFAADGSEVCQYDKVHLFDVDVSDNKGRYRESDTFIAGTQSKTVSLDGTLYGLSVCYDLRFPELYQQYQKQSCQVVTVPSAFTYTTGQKHWLTLLKARAIETQSFVMAANQVGTHEDGRITWGQSIVINPDGEIVGELDSEKAGELVVELDLELCQKIRQSMPLLKHKRL